MLLLGVVAAVGAFAPTIRAPGFPTTTGAHRASVPALLLRDNFIDWVAQQLSGRREKKLRPERIILVRHGQSEGNADRNAYSKTPDSKISLTEKGFAQGTVAGLQIRQLVGDESVRFFVSPYLRARQTLLAILQAFDGQSVQVSTEPRLREQDFGNFQDPDEMDSIFNERQVFGRFYYRFPNGEAGTDVFDRMASFITYLFRTMSQQAYFQGQGPTPAYFQGQGPTPAGQRNPAENYVLVTHGLLMRIFCMCYLRWTVQEFEQVWNPSNCEIWVLQKVADTGTYELAGRWRASPYGGSFVDIQFGESKKEPLFAHMKRPLVSRTVTPGAPDALDADELAFLRDLPGPRSFGLSADEVSQNCMASDIPLVLASPMLVYPQVRENRAAGFIAGDAVLAYWAKDQKAASTAAKGGGSSWPSPQARWAREGRGAAQPLPTPPTTTPPVTPTPTTPTAQEERT